MEPTFQVKIKLPGGNSRIYSAMGITEMRTEYIITFVDTMVKSKKSVSDIAEAILNTGDMDAVEKFYAALYLGKILERMEQQEVRKK